MAVRERTYRPYEGELTDRWRRLLVIPRYAYADVLRSRRFLMVLVAALVFPVLGLLAAYLQHNVRALTILDIDPGAMMLDIDGAFFRGFYTVQGFMSFVIVFLVGPTLISSDLAHNGLPLYLARPLSRTEYLIGKLSVLAILQSGITWVPGLMLFSFEAVLEGRAWAAEHLWLAGAIFAAGWVTIIFLSLLVLAISALVKWHVMARGALLGLFAFLSIVSGVLQGLLELEWAELINPTRMLGIAWDGLFRISSGVGLPTWSAWVALGLVCALCLLVLNRRVRAYEVVG